MAEEGGELTLVRHSRYTYKSRSPNEVWQTKYCWCCLVDGLGLEWDAEVHALVYCSSGCFPLYRQEGGVGCYSVVCSS